MKKLNEVFSEETIYVVHSDANENNLLQEFDDLSAALEYAKDNIDELTYIEEVVKNSESDEIYSTEVIWSYDEDDAEDQVVCEWCHELAYESECRKELNLGLICRDCQSALYSRGEKPIFEEAYESDYAEGDDIFDQEFPEANLESKYNLETSSEPKKLMKEGLNSSEFAEYMQLCKEIGIKGTKDLESFMKEVGLESGCDPHKLLGALRKYRADLGPDFKIIHEEALSEDHHIGESLKESLDLPMMRASEIKRELELYGDIYFDLLEPVDESDEDGWRGANEIKIVDTGSGYAAYYEWLDQDGDYIESDPEFTYDTFEELLREIDGIYVTVTDMEEYLNKKNKKINDHIARLRAKGRIVKMIPSDWLENEKIRNELENPSMRAKASLVIPERDIYVVPEEIYNWLKKYLNEELKETKKMTKDELLDKEGTTDVDLINAGRSEEERVELSENYAVDNFNIPGFELQVTDEFEDEGVKGFNVIYSKNGVDIVEIEIWEVDAPISVTKNLYRPNLMNSTYDSFDGFVADLEYKTERYFTEQLEEGYKTDLSDKKVSEIKDELDLHGDISFDLTEPIEESDEDGWRSASELIIIEIDNGSYEGYYNWIDQDGDMIESGADEYYDNFEELLYAIDGVYVNIVDLDAYIGSQLAEELEEAKTSLNESQSQEISSEYNRLSKEYGIDFEDLVYGEKGFMKTKYPEGFPDFDGDVIYSEKYWAELEEWLKENNKLNESHKLVDEDLKDTIKRPEAPKDLSVVKEPGDPSISEGDLVWFNTRKGEDVVIQIIKFTKDLEGQHTDCKFVYTEPKVTRSHKERNDWWKEDNK